MTRLIDADRITYTPSVPVAVISRIINAGREEDAMQLVHVSRAEIDAQPTIDAVPVVRCYECTHLEYEDGLVWMCGRTNTPTGGIEGFCAWAEREENEHDPAD